jgi:hypothetical protein
MMDGAEIRSGDTSHTPRAGQRAGNGQLHKDYRPQDSAGIWTPSRALHSPPSEKASLVTLFDRLATAAAAHDGDAAAEIFGESA